MTKINNIAKNTSFLTLALIIQKIISFSYFAILARELDPLLLGKYYFAISVVAIISVIIDFGLTNVLVRETAKDNSRASELLGTVMMIKLPLVLISILVIIGLINFAPNIISKADDVTRILIYISLLATILDSFTAVFFGVIRGFHNLKFESFSAIIFQLILLGFGLCALYFELGLVYLMLALLLASIFNFCYSLFLVKFKWKLKIFQNFDYNLAKKFFLISLPFATYVILQKFYMYFDSVLLYHLAGEYYVGLYQISFKIIFALQFLPMAFMASLYPAFSKYYKKNKEQLGISFVRAVNYLLIIAIPISFGIVFLADKILLFFKPEYFAALVSLQIIVLSLTFIFLNFPIGAMLNACDRQKINTINMAITVLASIFLNLILIPKYNVVGASITVLSTNVLMFFLGIVQISKIIKFDFKNNLIIFLKIILAGIFMSFFVFYSKQNLNILIVVFFAALIYFLFLFLLKGIKKEDIKSIYFAFYKK